ncbi:unnamed protein product, partial [Ectocarpus sp. 12 AP-2014]
AAHSLTGRVLLPVRGLPPGVRRRPMEDSQKGCGRTGREPPLGNSVGSRRHHNSGRLSERERLRGASNRHHSSWRLTVKETLRGAGERHNKRQRPDCTTKSIAINKHGSFLQSHTLPLVDAHV